MMRNPALFDGARAATALRVLSIALGVFFLANGLGKISWFTNPSELAGFFKRWSATASMWNQWYLAYVAIPALPFWQRLVPLGEMSVGLALILGIQLRLAALVGLFMVCNISIAGGAFFRPNVLINGNVLPVLGGLLTIVIGARALAPLFVLRTRPSFSVAVDP
jgi:thiosulfate dehydrogenase (quinone) large subunit